MEFCTLSNLHIYTWMDKFSLSSSCLCIYLSTSFTSRIFRLYLAFQNLKADNNRLALRQGPLTLPGKGHNSYCSSNIEWWDLIPLAA